MKAVVYDKSKAPDFLELREIEKPVPGENEVLVKIVAVSLNAADYRSMKMGLIPKRKIFGSDISGFVEAVGNNVSKFACGDEVFGDTSGVGFGGLAEYVVVPEKFLAMKPKEVSFEDAAAVPMASVTALQALRDKGKISNGKKVLIFGAGGGVGTFAVQISKYFGAEVTSVCSEKNLQLTYSLGADYAFDYNKEDFSKVEKKFDLILAVNGKRSLKEYKRLLESDGILVVVGGALSQIFITMFFGKIMSMGSKKFRLLAAKPNTEDLEFVINLVKEDKIKPVIDKVFPLSDSAKAMQYVGKGHAGGKVVIISDNRP